MTNITSPLKQHQTGTAVTDLQDALLLLLDSVAILIKDKAARLKLSAALVRERSKQTYGTATSRLVRTFQAERELKPTGNVDRATATALNDFLKRSTASQRAFGSPLAAGAVGPDVASLQEILTGLGHAIGRQEITDQRFGASTTAAVTAWQTKTKLPMTGSLDLDALKQLWDQGRTTPRTVRGVVRLDDGSPVPDLVVVAFDRDFRAEEPLGRSPTDREGRYRIVYKPNDYLRDEKGSADLGVRVLAANGKAELYVTPSRELLMNAPPDAIIDVTVSVPLGTLPSEFDRIASNVRSLIRDVAFEDVAPAADSDEASFLARETGFDEERIAHFVVAHRLAKLSSVRPDYFYSLLREDGLFGIGPNRPRVVQTPVGIQSDPQAVLYEAVLLDSTAANAAVVAAVEGRVVPPTLRKELDAIIQQLGARWRQQAEAYAAQELPRLIVKQIADLIDAGKTPLILALLGSFDPGDLPDLFKTLDARGVFDAANRSKAKTRLDFGALVGFHDALVNELIPTVDAAGATGVRDLAGLDPASWTKHVTRALKRASPKAKISGATARRLSSTLASRAEAAFPTATLTARLKRSKPKAVPNHADVAKFLRTVPEFELRKHRLIPFLKQQGIDPKTVTPDVLRSVEKIQRVFNVAGNYDKTEGLLNAGFGSAADIVAAGKSRFIADSKQHAAIGEPEARQLFSKARDINAGTIMLASNLRARALPFAIEGPSATALSLQIEKIVAEQPDLKALFGSTDVCECNECRSIYGAAAYIADLVSSFLRHRLVKDATNPMAPSTKTAKDVLFARRPDLGDIDLNCDNANIVVPHIDIVCELMEEAVSPDTGFPFNGPVAAGKATAALLAAVRAQNLEITDAAMVYGPYGANRFMLRDKIIVVAVDPVGASGVNWNLRRLRQTHGTNEERAASPEYVNAAAYTVLTAGKAAFDLPLDLFHVETRALLAAAGVPRAALMEALAVGGAPSADAIAGETLGLAASERALIFASSVANQPNIWGVAGPIAATQMAELDVFMQKTGLEYRDVEALIKGGYVSGGVNLFIHHQDLSCDTSKKDIKNLDDNVLDRIHRVLRLARKTMVAWRDIDRLAMGARLGGGDLGAAALRSLADLVYLAGDLKVDVARMVTWLDLIPTDGDRSDHALIFQNNAVTGPLSPDLAPAAIRSNEAVETLNPGTGKKLSAYAADLALGLGVRAADLALLLTQLSDATLLGPNPPLTFRALAALYGRISLARALGWTIANELGLERLSGLDPLAGTATLREFLKAARCTDKAAATIPDLEYRLARRAPDLTLLDLGDAAIGRTLESLRADMLKAAEANKSPYDPNLTAFEQVVAFETLLQRQPALDAAAVSQLVDIVRLDAPSLVAGATAKAVVDNYLAKALDSAAVKAAIDAVVGAPTEVNKQQVLKLAMNGLSASALQAASIEAAISDLATLLGTANDMTEVILRGARLQIGPNRIALLDSFSTGDIANATIALTTATTPNLYRAARLASSVVGISTPFKPGVETVEFMLTSAAALGWLELDGAPFEGGLAIVPLPRWIQLADAFELFATYPAVPRPGQPDQTVSVSSVLQLALGGGPKLPLLDELAALTGWKRDLVADADTRLGYAMAAYWDPANWRRIGGLIVTMNTLGVPMAEAVHYAADALTDSDRINARRMLRARYTDADWLNALKAIMDPIRERKRDALVAQLLATNPGINSPADLYDYLLTDTKWSAKMPSSRIVHAHGTLQLFIRRCMQGLEPKAVADFDGDADWNIWPSMADFRVWQVERKVWAEAQYYIRPAWRDDKTEPFLELESAVLQNDITPDNVAAALEGYLDRLDEIAFLDVKATCYDFDNDNLHIFACTKGGDPPIYFYRILQAERVLTPWTKVDLDISNNLIAFFRDKRLFLAWTTLVEKGNDQQQADYPEPSSSGPQDLPHSTRRTEIRLAVSEYTGSKWLPRRVSVDPLYTPYSDASLDQDSVFISVNPDSQRFTIDVYLGDSSKHYLGSFLLTGCKGYPEVTSSQLHQVSVLPRFYDTKLRQQILVKQRPPEPPGPHFPLLAYSTAVSGTAFQTLFKHTLMTPGSFRVTYPFQASEIDRLLTALINAGNPSLARERMTLVFGTLMPFFFEDNERGYILTPGFYGRFDERLGTRTTVKTFSNVRHLFVDSIALITKYLALIAAATTASQKQAVIDAFPSDPETQRLLQELASYRSTTFGFLVRNFYHPLVCYLRECFFEGGPKRLLARETQLHVGPFSLDHPPSGYAPSPLVLKPYPKEEMEFDGGSAYASYNWELALHIPHLVGVALAEAEQYDDAETWFRYIFDPLGSSNDPAPKRYWNTKPFYLRSDADYKAQVLTTLMERVAKDPSGAIDTELASAILDWRRNPLKPYLIARSRTVVFQQAIVDQTVRLYIARGDSSFRRDQLEDLVMAELDYSRAERLLGPRPKLVPPPVEVPPATYNQLESDLDLFGNALRQIENLLPDLSVLPQGGAELPPLPMNLESLYFCIPPSDKLYELWDTLEQRQANLRNSRTIDGVERTLSIFAPPLSVEAMIAAAASGLSISAILAGLSAPRPPYRFRVMARHALECAEAGTALSRSLEQALTSQDGEGLARLKAQQEIQYLKEQTFSLEQEKESATKAVASANQTKLIHQDSQAFYAGRPYMNDFEIAATVAYGAALALQVVTAVGYIAAGGLSLIPQFMIGAAGFGGSPTANASTGGEPISAAARDVMVGALGALSASLDKTGSMLEHQANYTIRSEDWAHQAKQAKLEMDKADIEIAIATIRETIAKEQVRLHNMKIAQATAEETYLRTKFTNRELFEWLGQQVRGLSKQMFNVAFEAAKAAEYCFNFELGVAESFVRSGQWDDKRRGLLAAENLAVDLRRMESAYLKRNVREKEITKELSLARLDPIALLELRTTGRCMIQIPEAVLDLEHSGDYFRRIKWLTVRVPCVAGPYASVPVKLTQTSNRLRFSTTRKLGAVSDADAYAEDPGSDTRFRYNVGAIQSFTTSRGDDDGGMFTHDVSDERYWTLEGSGLVGTMMAELPQALRPFDYGTISDLVLTIRYTARDGGGAFKTMVDNGLRERLNVIALAAGRVGLFQAFDLRRDRPDLWNQLTTTGTTSLTITKDDLPYYTSSRAIAINATRFVAKVKSAPANFTIKVDGAPTNLTVPAEAELEGLLSSNTTAVALDTPKTIGAAAPGQLEEMIVIVNYAMNP